MLLCDDNNLSYLAQALRRNDPEQAKCNNVDGSNVSRPHFTAQLKSPVAFVHIVQLTDRRVNVKPESAKLLKLGSGTSSASSPLS